MTLILNTPFSGTTMDSNLVNIKAQRITDEIAISNPYDEQLATLERLQALKEDQLDSLERVLSQYGNIIDPNILVNEFLGSSDESEVEHSFAMLNVAMALNGHQLQMDAICELPEEVRETGLAHRMPIRPEHLALVIRASASADEWEEPLYEYAMSHLKKINKVLTAISTLRSQGAIVCPEAIDEYMAHPMAMFSGVL